MLYDNWKHLLDERFPPRDPDAAQRDWAALKKRIAVGQAISGKFVSKAHFGAWLDIGVGFPALLLITDVEGLTPERYRNDEWCAIGSPITAEVLLFNDSKQAIRVSQRPPH
jgi:ribosomal protein S1